MYFTTKEENLENEHIHYITGAPLETAVRASMSFPAIYTTCPYDKYNFIDGGSKDNLPVKFCVIWASARFLQSALIL